MIAISQHTSERAVAHRFSQTHSSLASVRWSLPAPDRLSKLFSAAMLLAVPLFSAAVLSAKQTPDPVTVEGAVEVVNDSFNTPFLQGFVTDMGAGQNYGELAFDIPDGKRLVIETINVSVSAPPGQIFVGTFTFLSSRGGVSGNFPVQRTGFVFPGSNRENQVAHPPLRARVDARPGVTNEVTVVVARNDATETARLTVNIFGYLVDL